jgi:hypothetical protein
MTVQRLVWLDTGSIERTKVRLFMSLSSKLRIQDDLEAAVTIDGLSRFSQVCPRL